MTTPGSPFRPRQLSLVRTSCTCSPTVCCRSAQRPWLAGTEQSPSIVRCKPHLQCVRDRRSLQQRSSSSSGCALLLLQPGNSVCRAAGGRPPAAKYRARAQAPARQAHIRAVRGVCCPIFAQKQCCRACGRAAAQGIGGRVYHSRL